MKKEHAPKHHHETKKLHDHHKKQVEHHKKQAEHHKKEAHKLMGKHEAKEKKLIGKLGEMHKGGKRGY